jgi:hypothetical protein
MRAEKDEGLRRYEGRKQGLCHLLFLDARQYGAEVVVLVRTNCSHFVRHVVESRNYVCALGGKEGQGEDADCVGS